MEPNSKSQICGKCGVKHNKTKTHCCECKEIYDPKAIDHCHDCCQYYRVGLKHCCRCKRAWDTKKKNHCVKCCTEHTDKKVHCCKCRTIFDKSFVETHSNFEHCCKCKQFHDKIIVDHCKQCCFELPANSNLTHCCRCKIVWDNKTHDHCCSCKKLWNIHNETHCTKLKESTGWCAAHKVNCCKITDINFEHCCRCDKMIDKTTTEIEHCCTCCNEYYIGIKHCCKCQTDWDPAKYLHCCECNVLWDPTVYSHCCKCKKNFLTTDSHCCQCGVIYDSLKFKHCCQCKKNFKITDSHCCKCRETWDETLQVTHCNTCHLIHEFEKDHCCKCKKTIQKDKQHCTKCCCEHDQRESHCCKCKIVWDSSKFKHCCSCFTIHKNDDQHCCGCKKSWNETLQVTHCKTCHLIHETEKDHCCKCKKTIQKDDMQHCTKCCMEYKNNEKHCCKCKTAWINDINKIHCIKCCMSHDKNKEHCCCCGKQWNAGEKEACECGEIKRFIIPKIQEFLESKSIKNKYVISPCLGRTVTTDHADGLNCQSILKFSKAIKTLGKCDILEFLKDDANYVFALHGTPLVNGAFDICCNSWNDKFRGRTGQAYGRGEYFTTFLNTAISYAGYGSGAIVVSIIISPEKTTIVKKRFCSDYENWYIVDNPSDVSFCLPVAVLQDRVNIEGCPICPRRKFLQMMEQLVKKDNISICFEDGGKIPYNEESTKEVLKNIKIGNPIFDIIGSNGYSYRVDLTNMTQTNVRTNGSRQIYLSFV
jgi:hypothetical protein